MRYLNIIFIAASILLVAALFKPQTAQAQACYECSAISTHLDREVNEHEKFFTSLFFEDNILPALQLMTEQLSVTALQQVGIIGTFFDAKHQLETQRVLSNLKARAHKDYHPSMGMCEFGSNVKSLAASERKGEVNAVLMAQRSLDRQLGAANTSASGGPQQDLDARLAQFKETYCDPYDSNNGLASFCNLDGPSDDAEERARYNRDIDFVRAVDLPLTLDIDFMDGEDEASPDEEDIFALAANLYSHDVFLRPAPDFGLKRDAAGNLIYPEDGDLTTQQQTYLDMRAIAAKRSVAENSFNAIVGMKSAGSGGSKDFMAGILEELGIEDSDEINRLIGDQPSYHAQMEILTKKIYQDPGFYTDLYDKPANVSRKEVAMQAIGLMQKFDMLKSTLRKEASLSILLELAVDEQQANILRDPGGG